MQYLSVSASRSVKDSVGQCCRRSLLALEACYGTSSEHSQTAWILFRTVTGNFADLKAFEMTFKSTSSLLWVLLRRAY
eukprot:5440994-Pleurochrysis_carterae.AAC.1